LPSDLHIAFPWLITWPWLIKLDADGETKTVRGGAMPGTVAIGVVGYVGPSAFGLGAAKLIESGYILSMFWVALVLLTVMLLAVRLSFASVTVPAAGALAFLIAKFKPMHTQVIAAYGLAWLLLSGYARSWSTVCAQKTRESSGAQPASHACSGLGARSRHSPPAAGCSSCEPEADVPD
jgi:hypothetical protein